MNCCCFLIVAKRGSASLLFFLEIIPNMVSSRWISDLASLGRGPFWTSLSVYVTKQTLSGINDRQGHDSQDGGWALRLSRLLKISFLLVSVGRKIMGSQKGGITEEMQLGKTAGMKKKMVKMHPGKMSTNT